MFALDEAIRSIDVELQLGSPFLGRPEISSPLTFPARPGLVTPKSVERRRSIGAQRRYGAGPYFMAEVLSELLPRQISPMLKI